MGLSSTADDVSYRDTLKKEHTGIHLYISSYQISVNIIYKGIIDKNIRINTGTAL